MSDPPSPRLWRAKHRRKSRAGISITSERAVELLNTAGSGFVFARADCPGICRRAAPVIAIRDSRICPGR
jgi:hypothetical protein